MLRLVVKLLVVIVIGMAAYPIAGLAQKIDTVILRHFAPADYNAGTTNYSGYAMPDGTVLFANSNGVLIYDGSSWQLIKTANGYSVLSLHAKSDTVFVGGIDEIGYLVMDGYEYRYSSLNHLLDDAENIGECWQIVETEDGLYFGSNKNILLYDGRTIRKVAIKDAYIFKIGPYLLASTFSQGIKLIRQDKVIDSLATHEFTNDAVYWVNRSPEDSAKYLLFTSENGVFEFTVEPPSIKEWDTPATKKFSNAGFYDGLVYNDSLMACTSWFGGLFLISIDGSILRQIHLPNGLPDKGLHELFIDANDNIWITSDKGIYGLRLKPTVKQDDFTPRILIKGISSELGRLVQVENIFSPKHIVIDYTTPGFNQEDLQYAFFLEGYDDKWSPWTKSYKKEYTNLKHGKYTFHVRSRLSNTNEILAEANTSFGIVLPWYERPVIYVSALSIIIMIMGFRQFELKKSKNKLESIVQERTRQLTNEQEKLKQINKELTVANEELDNFVYRSSHDLIAPLKSLRGLMNLLRMEIKQGKPAEYIILIETSVLKLENFINSIMEYSINTKAETELASVDLNKVIDEILNDIKYYDNANQIKFSKEINCPELYTDEKRLKIVFSNLITNAIKYYNPSNEHPFIKIASFREKDEVIIRVEDNGLGIEKEHLPHIFNMFYRAHENAQGSGLGLYIVKDTVNRLDGTITVTSEVNKGSRFTVSLPIAG